MATSNYDEIVSKARAAMANGGSAERKPISSLSSPLLSIYLGFLGFACGSLFGTLTATPTLYGGMIGAMLGVGIAFVMRRRFQRKMQAEAAATFDAVDALEREAVTLEAEVAQKSGEFDTWEKK